MSADTPADRLRRVLEQLQDRNIREAEMYDAADEAIGDLDLLVSELDSLRAERARWIEMTDAYVAARDRAKDSEAEADELRADNQRLTADNVLVGARAAGHYSRAVTAEADLTTLREALEPFVEFLNPKALMQGAEWVERFEGYVKDGRAALDAVRDTT